MAEGYTVPTASQADIISNSLDIAGDGCDEISVVLRDIQTDNILGNDCVADDTVLGDHRWIGNDPNRPTPATTTPDPYLNATGVLVKTGTSDPSATSPDVLDKGGEVLYKYNVSGTANITQASGAMVIDDLMQRISTKVQVASQMLSTANNINKAAARVISQG